MKSRGFCPLYLSLAVMPFFGVATIKADPSERVRIMRMLASSEALRPSEADEPFPDFDPAFPPPANTKTFKLSQSFPPVYKLDESFPWSRVDVRKEPVKYLREVLNWCVDGMEASEWVSYGKQNNVRKWFHAPWMHDDGKDTVVKDSSRLRGGREPLRGLTRERDLREGSLGPKQTRRRQAWAVSLYNDRGGYTFGRVWKTPSGFPDPAQANFPANAVSIKLLFTDATDEEVPFLKGSLKWDAYIYDENEPVAPKGVYREPKRQVRHMRVLQIDVAIKDPNTPSKTGWVLGTYVYDGSAPGEKWWERMVPVGASWGDDGDLKPSEFKDGVRYNERLKETALNKDLVTREPNADGRAFVTHVGMDGRLNGPVDNPASSCISCHGRAGIWYRVWDDPQQGADGKTEFSRLFGLQMPIIASFKPDETDPYDRKLVSRFPQDEFDRWFGLIGPGAQLQQTEFQDPKTREKKTDVFITLDYSLQLAVGMRNFYHYLRNNPDYLRRVEKAGLLSKQRSAEIKDCKLPEQSR